MKKVFEKMLEWARNHKKAAIGMGAGCVALIVSVVTAIIWVTGVIATGGRISGSSITRGEWIKLYGEKFSLVNYEQSEPYYSDVSSDNEAFVYVQAFVENEIMSGEGEAKLDEKVTFGEVLTQLSRYYGDNYIKGATGKNELTDSDRIVFLKESAEISVDNIGNRIGKEAAEELLDLVWNHYLNREFKNVNEVNYAENVIDLSDITNYKYSDNQLIVSTDKEISEGKVLVLGENDEYIAGLAVKVTKVSRENSIYTLDVTKPELEEIVDSFYLSTSQLVDFEGFEPAEGVSIEEAGTENVKSDVEIPVAAATFNNIIKADRNELLAAKFNADRSGKFLKLNLNLTEGKISTSAIWEEFGYELETSKAKLYQYTVDEKGKLTSKFDDSGFEVKGGLTLKDLVLNGEVEYDGGKKGVKFDFNTGIKVQPSLSLKGNIKGKQIKIGSKNIHLCYGFAARADIYLYVDFSGEISVKPEFTGLVNVKKNAGKSVNITGKCDSKFESEIKCEAKVKAGPDIVINYLGLVNVLDTYAYMGFGADTTYSTKNPLKVVVDVYAPTLEAGLSDADNTVLKKFGIKVKIKVIDKKDALFKCPFTAQYTYDVLTKDWNYSQEINTPSEGVNETSGDTNESTSDGNGTESDSSGSSGGTGTASGGNEGTDKPAGNTYKLSDASYEWATGFGTNTYLIKKNGLYGVVDFNGNVKIPVIYEDFKDVGNNEFEFVKNGIGYVYNLDTCREIFNYNKIELISNPDDYNDNTYTREDGRVIKLTISGSKYIDGEWVNNYYRIEKEYNKGMMLEIIPYSGWSGSTGNTGGIGHSAVWDCDKFIFKKGNTNTVIASGYGWGYNMVTDSNWWNGISFSSIGYDNTAVAIERDFVANKTYINIVSKDGVTKKEASEGLPGGAHGYSNGWLKSFYVLLNLTNCYTGQNIKMPYEHITHYYAGRGEYYAVSVDNGVTFDICKGNAIISKGWKTVNFDNDKYIITTNSSGEYVYLDYNGNMKGTYKDSSVIFDGKALVSDGTGIYYIDEKLNKISGYIYKGKIDSGGCMGMTVKINNRYYLISQ